MFASFRETTANPSAALGMTTAVGGAGVSAWDQGAWAEQCPKQRLNAGAVFYGDGDLLYDFQAETFQRGDVHGGVGEEADALDAKVG